MGIRLNYRDRRLRWIHGLNATVWYPYDEASATITGIALGVPLTDATRLRGLGVGAGLVFESDVHGVAIAPIGVGSGNEGSGIVLGGLGAGTGGRFTGLLFGGLGVGAGDDLNGIGLSVGGVAAGDRLTGLGLGGLAVGAGQEVTGVALSGLALGSSNMTGLSITGGYTRIEDGRLKGVSIGAFNDVRGSQDGLTIGVCNYARRLNGVQIGLINVANNNPSWATVLPVVNLNL